MSRSCAGGSVLSVREMASVQETPGGRSLPCGSGGSEEGPPPLPDAVGAWMEAEGALALPPPPLVAAGLG
jgi:hypothetical protein